MLSLTPRLIQIGAFATSPRAQIAEKSSEDFTDLPPKNNLWNSEGPLTLTRSTGPCGAITGEIVAEDVVIAKNGKIEGNIKAKSIKMLNGSYIKGEMYYNTLSIEDGSVIEGQCHYEINDKKQNSKDGKVDKNK